MKVIPLLACSVIVLLVASPGTAQSPVPCSIVYQRNSTTNKIVIGWEAVTNFSYNVLATTDLNQSWVALNPAPLLASSNRMTYQDVTTLSRRFYRVVNRDVPSTMVWIPPGTFTMGSPMTEALHDSDETPHQVTISRGFWMGRHEVTQREYVDVIGANPSQFTGDLNRPVECVSWFDATNYCSQLTARERAAGRLPAGYLYRLPREAEWEYACRAGTTTAFHYGDELRSGMANFDGRKEYPPCEDNSYYCWNSSGVYLVQTTPVESYAPNAWGLNDMHGNVLEWCHDWYGLYPAGSATDPTGPATGSNRLFRGGAYTFSGGSCRSAFRFGRDPANRLVTAGFRVVLVPSQP
jgi:formylglycine-generating enzyme required for sulfatase activity